MVGLTSAVKPHAGATTAKAGAAGPATMRAVPRATVVHSVALICEARWRGLEICKSLINLFHGRAWMNRAIRVASVHTPGRVLALAWLCVGIPATNRPGSAVTVGMRR